MYALMIYSLKVGACLAVFYLFFKLLLSRETFHRLNRIVVLAAMVLSFLLPVCVITVYREVPALPEVPAAEQVYEVPADPQPEPFPWDTAVSIVFLVGAGVTLLSTLGSVCGVVHMIRRGRRERLADGTVLVRTEQAVTPFSWCRYIVLSEKDLAENGDAIVLHEKAHLRLRHSVDLLVTDLAGCLQWFNPAMWLLRRELRAIHEYEADEAVLNSGVDAKHYQLLLIRKAAGGRWYSVANSFNHSKLKNRITMMLRKRSSRWAVAKVFFALPLTGLALGAFARTAYVFPDDKGKKENVTILVRNAKIDPSDGKSGNPLILVDGIEVASIDSIPADRIALVTVLKDAASKASYGEKGKDGVMIVTTKDADAEQQAQEFSFVEGSSFKITVSGAELMSDSLAGKVRKITCQIDGKGDSLGGNMVWKINGQDVDADNPEGLSGNIRSIRFFKDAVSQGENSDGRDGVVHIMTKQTTQAADAGLNAAEAGMQAARAGLETARKYMSAEEWTNAQKQLEEAQKQLDEARAQASEISVSRVVAVDMTDSVADIEARKVAGHMVQMQEADNPKNSKIVIRGTGKANYKKGEEPLFVIDGKVQNIKKMNDLEADRIETISVLKEKSAVEKYGKKARNGVIEITTKK